MGLSRLPMLVDCLLQHDGPHSAILLPVLIQPLRSAEAKLSKLKDMIETTIDLRKAEMGEFIIKSDFDERLGGNSKWSLTYCLFQRFRTICPFSVGKTNWFPFGTVVWLKLWDLLIFKIFRAEERNRWVRIASGKRTVWSGGWFKAGQRQNCQIGKQWSDWFLLACHAEGWKSAA